MSAAGNRPRWPPSAPANLRRADPPANPAPSQFLGVRAVCFDNDGYHHASTISLTTGSSSGRAMLTAWPRASTTIAAGTGAPASLRARRPFPALIDQSRQGAGTSSPEIASATRRCAPSVADVLKEWIKRRKPTTTIKVSVGKNGTTREVTTKGGANNPNLDKILDWAGPPIPANERIHPSCDEPDSRCPGQASRSSAPSGARLDIRSRVAAQRTPRIRSR